MSEKRVKSRTKFAAESVAKCLQRQIKCEKRKRKRAAGAVAVKRRLSFRFRFAFAVNFYPLPPRSCRTTFCIFMSHLNVACNANSIAIKWKTFENFLQNICRKHHRVFSTCFTSLPLAPYPLPVSALLYFLIKTH